MATSETLAAQLARCVERFRDAGAKEEQKAEFRALMGLLETEPLILREETGRVTVNGSPVDRAAVASLADRMALHGIAGLTVPRGPLPAEVFELVKALAAQPGVEDVAAKLEAAGAGRVFVVRAPVALPHTAAPLPPLDAQPAPPAPSAQRPSLGTEGILRGEPMTDIISDIPVPGVGFITHDAPLPSAERALPAKGKVKPSSALPGAFAPVSAPPEPPPMSPPPPPPQSLPPSTPPPPAPAAEEPPPPAFSAAVARTQATGALLQELERSPEAPNVGDLLAVLGRQVEDALHNNRLEQALTIAVAIVRLEQRVPEGSARRHYGIALRRMYSKTMLKSLAALLSVPVHEADAVLALRRGGLDAVEVLVERLIAAPAISERRAMFDTLRQMQEGRDQLIPLLHHRKWFVVRNVAELIGELGLEEAVPELARCLEHEDERVRKVVALALAKIGSAATAEPLRRALRDKSAEVRMQVAVGIGGRRTTGVVMPLVVALQAEEDETVRRELILALGRIGTPDAVQALIKIAQPSGRLFDRKPAALRLAAVEALRLAGTAPALGTLEGLSGDGDKQVRAAAQAGVAALTKKPSSG
jgi:HEAT repeat protein